MIKSHSELLRKHDKKFEGLSYQFPYSLKDFVTKLKSEINKRGSNFDDVWKTYHNGVVKIRLSYDNESISFSSDVFKKFNYREMNFTERRTLIDTVFSLKDFKDYKVTNVLVSKNLNSGEERSLLVSKESVEFYLDGLYELRQYKTGTRLKTQKIKKITGIGLKAQLEIIAKEVNPLLILDGVDNNSGGNVYITCGVSQIKIKKLRVKNREYINCKEKMRALFQYVSDLDALRSKIEFPIEYESN